MVAASHSQEVLLSGDEVLQRALEANTGLKISQAAFREAQGEFRQTHSLFLPEITASHTGIVTTNPLMAFGSKLNQEILTQADFNPDLLNDPQRTENYATLLEVRQPLINIDGLFQRKAARYKMEAAALQAERSRDYLTLQANAAYMNLQLAHKAVAVTQKALRAAEANLRWAESNYRQGYLQKQDLLEVQVRVSEVRNQWQQAQSQVANASDALAVLMDEPVSAVYVPRDSLIPQPAAPSSWSLSEERPDIRAMSLAAEAYSSAHRADKTAFLPRLNAFGTYALYDDELLRFGADGYTIGAELRWDLFGGHKRLGKVQSSRAAMEKSQLEQAQYYSESQRELQRAERALDDARARLELTRQALEQSAEALRIRTNRFREGLEKTADLLTAEANAAGKELEYYQTIFEYNYALAYLKFLAAGNTAPNGEALNP